MQIIGTLKCRDTKKCRLWFEQRGVPYHFVDLAKRSLSPRELSSIASVNGWDAMMDRDGKIWKTLQLEWKYYDPQVELADHPFLLKIPVVRHGNRAIIGLNPEGWTSLVETGGRAG